MLLELVLKTVTAQHRIRRQQLLLQAEGYLDLITVFSDQWQLRSEVSDPLAQRALDALESLDKLDGNHHGVLYLKGQALRAMHRYQEAVVPLISASKEDPHNAHIFLAIGWCYKRSNRLDLAIEALEEALAIDPTESIIHYNLACYWSLARNAALALHYLAKALEISPDWREMVAAEEDFDPIRHDSDFQALTSVVV